MKTQPLVAVASLLGLAACGSSMSLPTLHIDAQLQGGDATTCATFRATPRQGFVPLGEQQRSCEATVNVAIVLTETLHCDSDTVTRTSWTAQGPGESVWTEFPVGGGGITVLYQLDGAAIAPDNLPSVDVSFDGDALVARFAADGVGPMVERHEITSKDTEDFPRDPACSFAQTENPW